MTSPWRDIRNAAARARFDAALPATFPAPVLVHARGQRWVPDLPRRAIESYWRAHPIRADRLARALAARSGPPPGWAWTLTAEDGPAAFRRPPAPFHTGGHDPGPGRCRLCGQPVFHYGWHRDLWGPQPTSPRARWHAACAAAWTLWKVPNAQVKILGRLQKRRCALTGERLRRDAEADHRIPLFHVWREERDRPWPELLAYWGFPNLQAVNSAAHRAKSATEAANRAAARLHRQTVPADLP